MIGDIKKFRFWCQKVIPLVYDNSLSYYEVLCKVVNYLNNVIEDVNSIPDYIDSVIDEKLSDDKLKEIVEAVVRQIEDVISLDNEEANTNSSKDYTIGDWLWSNGMLYKAIRVIDAGDTLIVGTNLEQIELEDVIKNLETAINNEIQNRTDADTALQGAIDGEIQNRVDADTALQGAIDGEIQNRVDADTALQTSIDTLIANKVYTVPEEYGAVGDGVADDSDAVQSAVNSGKIVYLRNKYAIDSIEVNDDCTIIGTEDSMIYPNCVENTILFKNVFTVSGANLTLKNVNIEGKGRYQSTTYAERYCLIVADNADYLKLDGCTITNIGHNYVSETEPMNDYVPLWIKAVDVMNVDIENCIFNEGGSEELMVITPWEITSPSKPSIRLVNNVFNNCEHGASMNLFAYDVNVEHNTFNNFVYGGSIFNLSGENVTCAYNNFNGCNVGSVFDAIESCWFYAEHFNVLYNNFTGSCDIFAEHVGTTGECIGNNVEANTLFVNELTVYSTNNVAPMLRNTKNRTHGKCIIRNNKCIIKGGTASIIRAFIVNANATSDIPFSDYGTQDLLLVDGNTFNWTTFFHSNSKFFIGMPSDVNNICVSNNILSNPNTDNLGRSAKWLVYLDNRYLNRVVKSLSFINNVITDIDATLTNGIRLYEVMNADPTVVNVINGGNVAYNSTLTVGSTNYTNLLAFTAVT